jgi:MFS family permease
MASVAKGLRLEKQRFMRMSSKKLPVPKGVPRGVVVLGLVSLLMDLSSETIHNLMPLFLVSVLGASALAVGFIEGIAEGTASIAKLFSGALSDWLGRRKPLVLLGYGLAALSKPLFPLATSVPMVLAARVADRIGKGIRGAPRDALIADLTSREGRGSAFGLRQSLDTVGAFLAPLAAMGLMLASGDNFRLVFWLAVIPAFAAVALIVFWVEEPVRRKAANGDGWPIRKSALVGLGRGYWWIVAVSALLTVARLGEAFLLLRAADVGLAVALTPSVFLIMNLAYALSAYPLGRLSDQMGRWRIIGAGVCCLVAAHSALAFTSEIGLVLAGAVLWGVHMGATQGLVVSLVADAAGSKIRGTAFGIFHLVTGLALLAGGVLAGGVWTVFGASMAFVAGGAVALIALIVLAVCPKTPSPGTGAS